MQEVISAVWLRFILVMLSKTAKNPLETSAGLIVIQIHRKEIFKITRTHSGMIRVGHLISLQVQGFVCINNKPAPDLTHYRPSPDQQFPSMKSQLNRVYEEGINIMGESIIMNKKKEVIL